MTVNKIKSHCAAQPHCKPMRHRALAPFGARIYSTYGYPPTAYCVYEVYSWDVMEPATYFLMVRGRAVMVKCLVLSLKWSK